MGGSKAQIILNDTGQNICLTVNDRQGGDYFMNFDRQQSEKNLETEVYFARKKYANLLNLIKEKESILQLTQKTIELLEERIKTVRQMPESKHKWIDLINLIPEYINVKMRYNQNMKIYLYAHMQVITIQELGF